MFQISKSNMQLLLTRRCQLRCRYCPVRKRDADMDERAVLRAVQLLMTHRSGSVRLDFGGGEPFLRFDLMRKAMERAETLASRAGKKMSFYAVTNGIALTPEALGELSRHDVFLEISLDGTPEDHNRFKVPFRSGIVPYDATRRGVEAALRAKIPLTAVMVASPANCVRLFENFSHILSLGVREVEINYALGTRWEEHDVRALLRGFERIVEGYGTRFASGELVLGNLRGRLEPALLNSELLVETDGGLHIMSEWLFETTPPTGRPVYSYGDVFSVKDINGLYWSRFHSHYTLVRLYEGKPEVRRLMLNNIRLGERLGTLMRSLKERVFGGCAA